MPMLRLVPRKVTGTDFQFCISKGFWERGVNFIPQFCSMEFDASLTDSLQQKHDNDVPYNNNHKTSFLYGNKKLFSQNQQHKKLEQKRVEN